MVKSMENGPLIPPFLLKCYEMVDDQSTDGLISWGKTGDSFIISNQIQFQSEILPKYFKHNNFSSFVRQLNIYGFRKIDTDQWEFANEGFIKGQKHFLKNICRRKQSQNRNPQQKSSQDDNINGAAEILCEDKKKTELLKEIETLSTDKKALTEELILLGQHQQTSEKKLLVLRDQLKGMEENQQQMLSFIVMAMQNPGFFVQLLHPKDTNWSRMSETGKNSFNRVFEEDDDDEMNEGSDGMIVRYQSPKDESMNYMNPPAPSTPPENSLELDLSLDEVKDLFMNIDFSQLPPFDEKFLQMDNFFLPKSPEGGESMLEQLLLSSSSNMEENKEEEEEEKEGEKKSNIEKETNHGC